METGLSGRCGGAKRKGQAGSPDKTCPFGAPSPPPSDLGWTVFSLYFVQRLKSNVDLPAKILATGDSPAFFLTYSLCYMGETGLGSYFAPLAPELAPSPGRRARALGQAGPAERPVAGRELRAKIWNAAAGGATAGRKLWAKNGPRPPGERPPGESFFAKIWAVASGRPAAGLNLWPKSRAAAAKRPDGPNPQPAASALDQTTARSLGSISDRPAGQKSRLIFDM
jgi:hypothetical protein